jgi:hypothetical protein
MDAAWARACILSACRLLEHGLVCRINRCRSQSQETPHPHGQSAVQEGSPTARSPVAVVLHCTCTCSQRAVVMSGVAIPGRAGNAQIAVNTKPVGAAASGSASEAVRRASDPHDPCGRREMSEPGRGSMPKLPPESRPMGARTDARGMSALPATPHDDAAKVWTTV